MPTNAYKVTTGIVCVVTTDANGNVTATQSFTLAQLQNMLTKATTNQTNIQTWLNLLTT